MADLHVMAVTRRVVEVAAQCQVDRIMFSPAMRDRLHLDARGAVDLVHSLSGRATMVGRLWGGYTEHGVIDRGVMDIEVGAGYRVMHLDVSRIPKDQQPEALRMLFDVYRDRTLEIGSSQYPWQWTEHLLDHVVRTLNLAPETVIVPLGAGGRAGRQSGNCVEPEELERRARTVRSFGSKTTLHHVDWITGRNSSPSVDAYLLGPELADVEINALLTVLDAERAVDLLRLAYSSHNWSSSFGREHHGTWFERARIAAPFVLENDDIKKLTELDGEEEHWVRTQIQDAIERG